MVLVHRNLHTEGLMAVQIRNKVERKKQFRERDNAKT